MTTSQALVIHESLFGNTEQVARAVARGLAEQMNVELVDVGHAPRRPDTGVVLLVLGGPTHAFSMTREQTRADAYRQGATQGSRDTGLREWLGALPAEPVGQARPLLATFDTRVAKVRRLPGSAARAAAREARRHGYRTGAPPESFYVADVEGPLLAGELDRATEWGRRLAATALGRPEAAGRRRA